MSVAELTAKIDELHDLARDAGRDYDYLVFGSEQLRYDKDSASGSLGAYLAALEEDLAQLAIDLRTLPVTA